MNVKLLPLSKLRWRVLLLLSLTLLFAILLYLLYSYFYAPTRIIVVNALKSQQADIVLSNDHPQIKVDCIETEEMESLEGYDAVVIYARRLFLTPEQEAEVKRVASRGIPVYTKTLRSNDFVENHNLSEEQMVSLQQYFDNESRQNYRNGLRFLRHIATPQRWGDQALALISGITFPMEGNREHVDTLITMLTEKGFNVYPMTCSGKKREKMLHQLKPDSVVYLAMGRIGNDTLVQWMQQKNIALFCPFPLSMTHQEWLQQDIPMSSGSKNARIVIPEIDGGTAPFCIATQNPNHEGYHVNTAEVERCEMLVEHISRCMALRRKKNSEKRIAIGYFKRPGKDALLASGMEVIPSIYNLLKRLAQEGYDVSGLPTSLAAFAKAVKTEGLVLGSYAKGAQQEYMKKGHPLWISPPHSYLAPYLYLYKGFQADALIHFGTHGNLEFTPGRDAGMRPQDWSQQLIGPTPHFYYYTTSNIGEAIIAKRRSGAVLLTYLTPPYAESGMRQKYQTLHQDIHRALSSQATPALKQRIMKEGLHRTLRIDSTLSKPLTRQELERIDNLVEEIINEPMQGAYYTLGQPYTEEQLAQTVRAIVPEESPEAPRIKQLLIASTQAEIDNMIHALNGGTIAPAPGGDPILNDNVLPTGRNMFSINPDNTPDPLAWEDGKRMAEQTIADYKRQHGQYPRKVSYTFWAGEFIATGGATIACPPKTYGDPASISSCRSADSYAT